MVVVVVIEVRIDPPPTFSSSPSSVFRCSFLVGLG